MQLAEMERGQNLWYKDKDGAINFGVVSGFYENSDWVRFRGIEDCYNETRARAQYCFATKDELHAALEAESKANIAGYMENIQDVNSLVEFLISHTEDPDVKEAATQKAGELLGGLETGRQDCLENFADAVEALGDDKSLEMQA